ncbi:MAG TPA: DUF6569 family protein [Thermomicrobiales bacterium]
MGNLFTQRCDALWVEDALTHKELTVFPLSGVRHGEIAYTLLTDAVAQKTLHIAEMENASVDTLRARNTGALPVLIVNGQELIGGKQNRIINSTVLVPPGDTALPVSCVEHGRWDAPKAQFAPHDALYPALRTETVMQVAASLRQSGTHTSDQGAIWSSIAERHIDESIRSPTGAMADLYDRRRGDLAAFERAIPYPEGAVGMVAAIGGRVTGLELFDAPATMAALWPMFVRAAALDALRAPTAPAVAKERAIRMMRRIHETHMETFRSPGIGRDIRLTGGGIAGAALVCQGIIIHTTLFRQLTIG